MTQTPQAIADCGHRLVQTSQSYIPRQRVAGNERTTMLLPTTLLLRLRFVWTTTRWLHWAVVVAIPMLFFLIGKLVALSAILNMYASKSERTPGTKTGGVLLGMVQDFLVTTLLVVSLVLVELVAMLASQWIKVANYGVMRILGLGGLLLKFVVVAGLMTAAFAFFAADMLLVRSREMRFTTDLITMYQREKDQASAVKVDPREIRLARETVIATALVVLGFACVFVGWVDLLGARAGSPGATKGNETRVDPYEALEACPALSDSPRTELESSKIDTDGSGSSTPLSPESDELPSPVTKRSRVCNYRSGFVLSVVYVALFAVTQKIAVSVSPVLAAVALNTTLNELFRDLFDVKFQRSTGSGVIKSAADYLHGETESYELFQSNVLYRRTTGFKGPLAFDVTVEEDKPPNVLVIGVESFRYLDSLYLVGNTSAGQRLAKHNLTLTPQFDRWAKRGVAFPNMWSSWQTSRSLESILFGQVVYDSVTDTGTTRGRRDTKLEGMPQLFKQKGYETIFTTGCILTYDQWDAFLPSHGFDTVMGYPRFKEIALRDYGITQSQLTGPEHRGYHWGVHDDLSFDILGDLMINKTKEQADRVARGEAKKPWFLNHYTISSHGPFDAFPTWFANESLPDFTPLCEGWESECDLLKNYGRLRYFTDKMLGKFLDRMEVEGVLNDTIVVIVGDHGQSPEMENPVVYQTAVTRVASTLIAEGRLGEHAGTTIDDATHHYDLLNTLADIVGVPNGGFLQTGVGRSLKRTVPFGSRPVWSNNPMKKLSAVRGHERLVYDRAVSAMGLFDTVSDPLEHEDLLPSVRETKYASLLDDRRAGRELNAYFKHRWDKKCLTSVSCL